MSRFLGQGQLKGSHVIFMIVVIVAVPCWQIAGLDTSTSAMSEQLILLEQSAYQWQLKIFDSQIDILTEDEQRLRSAIDNIKLQHAGSFHVLLASLWLGRLVTSRVTICLKNFEMSGSSATDITSSFISVKTERSTTTICHAGQRLFTCSYAYAATQDSHNRA